MALHPDFPRSPYAPLVPSQRWFPADETLRTTAYDKLLPPLVAKIREQVHAWRQKGYAGASPTSIGLLRWWFADQQQLEQWVAAFGTPQQVALRSRIVLAAAAGESDSHIAQRFAINRKTVILWRARVAERGPESVWDIAPGRGRKPVYGADTIEAVINATLQTTPKGMTHWSCRTMAASQQVGKSTINTIWQSHNLKPHRVKRFKLSRDAKFLEKLTDVVGLYRNPPDKAIVLCVDEKSQIQALDRTQPGLPLKKGRCGTMTHDYKRNGTTTLFAALDVLQGRVVGEFSARHRHQEFLKYSARIHASARPENADMICPVISWTPH